MYVCVCVVSIFMSMFPNILLVHLLCLHTVCGDVPQICVIFISAGWHHHALLFVFFVCLLGLQWTKAKLCCHWSTGLCHKWCVFGLVCAYAYFWTQTYHANDCVSMSLCVCVCVCECDYVCVCESVCVCGWVTVLSDSHSLGGIILKGHPQQSQCDRWWSASERVSFA